MTNELDVWKEAKKGNCDRAGQEYYLLYSSIQKNRLDRIPKILKIIIKEDLWKQWRWVGNEFRAATIDEYIQNHPPKGLGVEIKLIERLIADDPKAVDALDKARQRPAHLHLPRDVNNVDIKIKPRPRGNSIEAGMRSLRKNNSKLHAKVLEGEISVHKAMIEAGFRKKPTPFEIVMKLWPKLTKKERQCIIKSAHRESGSLKLPLTTRGKNPKMSMKRHKTVK